MTNYTISEELKEQLLTKGYIRLENAVPPALLKEWQALGKKLEASAMSAHTEGQQLHGCCVIKDPIGPRLMRYNDIHLIQTQASLDLLACPAMMAIARELCGRGAVPIQMDLLYKHQHPHPIVKWHQDAQHSRSYPYLNIGIYLDDAPADDGCLRYVAGTQHEQLDIEHISRDHGWEVPGVVELPAKAGDILIQDMMILHGSQPKRTPGVRRTIYVEYRPVEGIHESQAQTPQWAKLRQDWMATVLRHADKNDWPDAWQDDYPDLTGSDADIMQAIAANHEPPIPGVWENFPVERPDYPVPADMKDW